MEIKKVLEGSLEDGKINFPLFELMIEEISPYDMTPEEFIAIQGLIEKTPSIDQLVDINLSISEWYLSLSKNRVQDYKRFRGLKQAALNSPLLNKSKQYLALMD